MPCPSCDRTLAGLIDAPEGQRKFHCSFCGCLVLESGEYRDVTVPKLIREPRWIPAVADLIAVVRQAIDTPEVSLDEVPAMLLRALMKLEEQR